MSNSLSFDYASPKNETVTDFPRLYASGNLLEETDRTMSRYGTLTEDENIEVFLGFDDGLERFFLTIADARSCTGEAGTYLFHNMDHHPGVGMTLGEVTATLERFGMTLPPDLTRQLEGDALRYGVANAVTGCRATPSLLTNPNHLAEARLRPGETPLIRVLNWQAI